MKILTTPHPALRKKAKKVISLDTKTLKEINVMITLLKAASDPKGVGLAATQIGIDKQIFILIRKRSKVEVFINPLITQKSTKMFSDKYKKNKDRWLEGCLSIPKLWGFVDRPFQVTLEYQTFNYSQTLSSSTGIIPVTLKLESVINDFSDIESAYVQHEVDHLNGILFTDHILKQGGTIFKEVAGDLEPISFS